MSPTRAHSGLSLEKRRVLAPVGSAAAIWTSWISLTGSLHLDHVAGGGAKMGISLCSFLICVVFAVLVVSLVAQVSLCG
jgi:hypothetical protein